MSCIINNQLVHLVDELSHKSNKIYESKVMAFERVSYFIRCMYPGVNPVLYGSNAIGLALPSSDIDIMICQLPGRSR
jgi:DNA polymerase sigma